MASYAPAPPQAWPASFPAGVTSLALARGTLRAIGALPASARSLDLEGNLVSSAAPGADLSGLLSLALASNRIVSVRSLALGSAARLVQLDLRENFIASWPGEAGAAPALPALRYLNLAGNCLTGFAAREGTLGSLLVLDLSRNQLAAPPATATLPALRLLLLDDMRLGGPPGGAGAGGGGGGLRSRSLGALRVRDNQIEALGVLAGSGGGGGSTAPPLRGIAALDLDGNSLRGFAGLAEAFPCLEHLSLRRNKIAVPLLAAAGAGAASPPPPTLELPLLESARVCFNAIEDLSCLPASAATATAAAAPAASTSAPWREASRRGLSSPLRSTLGSRSMMAKIFVAAPIAACRPDQMSVSDEKAPASVIWYSRKETRLPLEKVPASTSLLPTHSTATVTADGRKVVTMAYSA